MRVLVTGATGFLGREIVEGLRRRGHTVRAVHRQVTPDLPADVESVPLDLRSTEDLPRVLDGVDLVVHAAARMRGTFDEQFEGTVLPTRNLLAGMREAGVTKIVLVSSLAVYRGEPGPAGRVCDETSPIADPATARDAYAATKLLQEQLLDDLTTAAGWEATIARPGPIYGPGHLWTNRLGYRLGCRVWLCVGNRAKLPISYVRNAGDAIALLAETTVPGTQVVNVVDDDPPSQREYRRRLRERIGGRRVTIVLPWPLVHGGALAIERIDRGLGRPLRVPGPLRLETALARWQPAGYPNRTLRELGWSQPVPWHATLDAATADQHEQDHPQTRTRSRLRRDGTAPAEVTEVTEVTDERADLGSNVEGPVASIIVPAYNEASSIERCLRAMLDGASPGEFDVVVVCNACTDATAAIARTVSDDVRVIETPVPSKTRAMNLGDAAARTFPRVYVDADVELSVEHLRRVVAPLLRGEVEASAPGMRFDTAGSPWAVRAFHEVWSTLPQVSAGLGGRGAYAVSEEGHARFGRFPDIIADDLFVDWTFPLDRRTVVDAESVVRAEADLGELLRRKSRISAGRLELLDRGDRPGATSGLRALATTTLTHPKLLHKVPVYVLVSLEAKRRGRRRFAQGGSPSWEPQR